MDQTERNNWARIAETLEASGATESWFYQRARAIADGKPDPMPNVSDLMGNAPGEAALAPKRAGPFRLAKAVILAIGFPSPTASRPRDDAP